MREEVKIQERVRIVVRDTRTGEVIEERELVPKVSFLDRVVAKLTGKRTHATVLSYGKEQAAKLFGGVSPAYSINQIGTDTGGWKTVTPEYIATGTLRVSNSLDPWTTAGTYSWIKCRNSGNPTQYHNSIAVTVTITSGQEWWATVDFVFS
ncbi:MAG: hypothetical protein ACTSPB_14255 [Candidatus Thorarchaeota archaeon]